MVIANILGIFLFLYLVWKRLKEDYAPEKIFSLSFSCIFAVIVGFIVSTTLIPSYWFWLELLAVTIGFLIVTKRQKIKFYEGFEGVVIGFLPWLSLFFISNAIKNSSLSSFLAFWTVLICIFVFFFIASHYRSFTWYKSGRIGLSSLVTLLFFFLMRIVISFFFPDVISLIGKFEVLLSGSTALLLLFVLYNLIRNKNEN